MKINHKLLPQDNFNQNRIKHWNIRAKKLDSWTSLGKFYQQRLSEIYRFIVPKKQNVLELGCGTGNLLASLDPRQGVGVDFSLEMISRAQSKYPNIKFITSDIHTLELKEKFDYIILSDLINDLWDVQTVFDRIQNFSHSRTRIIINFYSRLWEPILDLAQRLGLATSHLPQNWLTLEDVKNLLYLSGFEVIRHQTEILFPLPPKMLSNFFNKYLVKIWPFKHLALTNVVVARPIQNPKPLSKLPLVSVIVPARNEAGNIPQIFSRVPEMGSGTEIIFVEGHSNDDTYQAIEKQISAHPERPCKLLKQTGEGKGDAVRLGFSKASGEILVILDADLTVPPEDIPRFYNALVSGKGEFINGVRLVYPLEQKAMRFINLFGNKFFSLAFSWLLGQPIKDTLCGTKVLWKSDYEQVVANRSQFGDFDPFGDFDLIFGSVNLNLKLVDIPIRYKERTYGNTNIQRWKHGWLLFKMLFIAAKKIKFI